MEEVYAGSMLTIAAADAKNSNEGFLSYRDPLVQQNCRLRYSDKITVLVEPREWCCQPDGNHSYPGFYNLDSRGEAFFPPLLGSITPPS